MTDQQNPKTRGADHYARPLPGSVAQPGDVPLCAECRQRVGLVSVSPRPCRDAHGNPMETPKVWRHLT